MSASAVVGRREFIRTGAAIGGGLLVSLHTPLAGSDALAAEEKDFAAAYLKKFGKPAADKAWMGWITAKSLFDSIDAAKSTDPEAIIAALENWKGGSADNPYYYRKGDHQMLLKNLVVQVKPKITDKWDYFDVISTVPNNTADLEKVFGVPADNGCKMT